MGGFSMLLRGSSRDTHDVDVAVGCDMGQLIQAIAGEPRSVSLFSFFINLVE